MVLPVFGIYNSTYMLCFIATSIAYGRCVFGEFQLFSWSWGGEQMFLDSTTLRDVCFG